MSGIHWLNLQCVLWIQRLWQSFWVLRSQKFKRCSCGSRSQREDSKSPYIYLAPTVCKAAWGRHRGKNHRSWSEPNSDSSSGLTLAVRAWTPFLSLSFFLCQGRHGSLSVETWWPTPGVCGACWTFRKRNFIQRLGCVWFFLREKNGEEPQSGFQ